MNRVVKLGAGAKTAIPTMSAKSLRTLPVIYAVDEQQNLLPVNPLTCMLFEGDTNSTGGRKDVFPSSYGLRLSIQHCTTVEGGSRLLFLQQKRTGVENSYHCMGVPRTLADIEGSQAIRTRASQGSIQRTLLFNLYIIEDSMFIERALLVKIVA